MFAEGQNMSGNQPIQNNKAVRLHNRPKYGKFVDDTNQQ